MSDFTVTFIFDEAVVTTGVSGDIAIVERASALLKESLGIDCARAKEVSIHELPEGT